MTQLKELNPEIIDPYYVQVSRKTAAALLDRSLAEFDRLRVNDPRCPKGFKKQGRLSRVRFRLSDIYQYSELLMQDAEQTTNEEEPDADNNRLLDFPRPEPT